MAAGFVHVLRTSRWSVLAVVSLAVFIDMYLYGIAVPLMPRILRHANVPDADVEARAFWLYTAYAVGLFFATPALGVYSDRTLQRRAPMLVGLVAQAASTLFFAFARSYWLLVAARVAQGVAAASTWVVGFAMLADTFDATELGLAIGVAMAAHTAGELVGLTVSGWMGARWSIRWPFLICVFLTALDFVGRLFVLSPDPRPGACPHVGILHLLGNADVLLTLGTTLVVAASVCAVEKVFPLYLEGVWLRGPDSTSNLMLAMHLPQIVLAPATGWLSDRVPRHVVITAGLVAHSAAAPLLGVPVPDQFARLLVLGCVYGVAVCVAKTPVSPRLSAVVERIGAASFAQVFALVNMAFSVGMFLGPALVAAAHALATRALGMGTSAAYVAGFGAVGALTLMYAPLFFFGVTPDCASKPLPVPAIFEKAV